MIMATQASMNAAIAAVKEIIESKIVGMSFDTKSYWLGLVNRSYTFKDSVQESMSNPLAYFVVPLAGDGTKGRSHAFVIKQLRWALSKNATSKAHVLLRGVNQQAIEAGLSFSRAREDSNLGTVEGRNLATLVAQSKGDKKELAAMVVKNESLGLLGKANKSFATSVKNDIIDKLGLVAPRSISKRANKAIGE